MAPLILGNPDIVNSVEHIVCDSLWALDVIKFQELKKSASQEPTLYYILQESARVCQRVLLPMPYGSIDLFCALASSQPNC